MKEHIFLQKLPNTIRGIKLNELNTQYMDLHKKIFRINQNVDINRYINLFYESLENNQEAIKTIKSSSGGSSFSELELKTNKDFEEFMLNVKPYFEEKIENDRQVEEKAKELSGSFLISFSEYKIDDEKSGLRVLKNYQDAYEIMSNYISSSSSTEKEIGYKIRSIINNCFYDEFSIKIFENFQEKHEVYIADDNKGSHVVLNEIFSAGRIKREYDETLCSPKKNFSRQYSNGDINMGSVSCPKCIKSMIKMTSKK
jgi:hypothetical protein